MSNFYEPRTIPFGQYVKEYASQGFNSYAYERRWIRANVKGYLGHVPTNDTPVEIRANGVFIEGVRTVQFLKTEPITTMLEGIS